MANQETEKTSYPHGSIGSEANRIRLFIESNKYHGMISDAAERLAEKRKIKLESARMTISHALKGSNNEEALRTIAECVTDRIKRFQSIGVTESVNVAEDPEVVFKPVN